MKTIKYYSRIWWLLTRNAFGVVLGQRVALMFFLTGKILRFSFFIGFLYFLILGTKSLAGYSSTQAIFFFLVFNVVDVLGQFLFREVYRFRPKIVSGDFDLTLAKPANALFTSLMGGADIIDFITIPPLFAATAYVGSLLSPNVTQIFLFLLLVANGLLIGAAFHIAVLSMAIITLEIDHTIMIYRDLTSFGRFPVDVYKQPIQGILTYLVPVGIMVTFPAKALMGLVAPVGVAISLLVGIAAFVIALRFWNFALTKYTSASS
ncbi:MAG TPA: ABC-2 family transporter protein [Patescibacteria group bacterium]|nr:ABC-2 family transporter protein [Patescibacteria group bacterium]